MPVEEEGTSENSLKLSSVLFPDERQEGKDNRAEKIKSREANVQYLLPVILLLKDKPNSNSTNKKIALKVAVNF